MPVARRKDRLVYIALDRAIEKHNLNRDELMQAIEEDEIEVAELDDGTLILFTESLRTWMAGRVRRSQFAHLDGEPISITEAERKYGFSWSTIDRWVKRGYIREVGLADGYKKRRLINEADVAYARALADLKQPTSGQSVFS